MRRSSSRSSPRSRFTEWLSGDVNHQMLELVQSTLMRAGRSPVTFYMNSDGGEMTAGLGICDLFRHYRGRITVIVVGSAESMAAVILQAADWRVISQSSYLMIHQGTVTPPESHRKNIKKLLRLTDGQGDIADGLVLRRIQKKYPKYSWEKFQEETDFDMYFTAEQALRWNLVDRILK